RPQRADSLFLSLAIKAHTRRRIETNRARTYIERFLDACTGVVQEREQSVIALAGDGRAIRLRQNGVYFFRFQIARRMDRCLFRRNVRDFGTLRNRRRLSPGDKAEERSQSSEAAIACANSVSAFLLRILQESTYLGGREVDQY